MNQKLTTVLDDFMYLFIPCLDLFQFTRNWLFQKSPVRNIGLQSYLLERDWSVSNVEWFLNLESGILVTNCKSIYFYYTYQVQHTICSWENEIQGLDKHRHPEGFHGPVSEILSEENFIIGEFKFRIKSSVVVFVDDSMSRT